MTYILECKKCNKTFKDGEPVYKKKITFIKGFATTFEGDPNWFMHDREVKESQEAYCEYCYQQLGKKEV